MYRFLFVTGFIFVFFLVGWIPLLCKEYESINYMKDSKNQKTKAIYVKCKAIVLAITLYWSIDLMMYAYKYL